MTFKTAKSILGSVPVSHHGWLKGTGRDFLSDGTGLVDSSKVGSSVGVVLHTT